jgi:SAM-dependent methyltransferase
VIDDAADVAKQYANEANLRARQALWEEVEGENTLLVLWRTIAAWGPKRVLEVGGGQGELAARMQDELGASVTFLDQSERMVELARERGVEDAHVGDAQELPFPDDTFDTVVAAWMLYHVADLDRGLSEIVRVLKPGGALIAATNSVRHLEELRELVGRLVPGFERTFNSENGEEALRRHFASVERYDNEIVAIVRTREKLVAYRESTSTPGIPISEDVPLPFRVHGRSTIFFAQT